jgi:hypothetical protein
MPGRIVGHRWIAKMANGVSAHGWVRVLELSRKRHGMRVGYLFMSMRFYQTAAVLKKNDGTHWRGPFELDAHDRHWADGNDARLHKPTVGA